MKNFIRRSEADDAAKNKIAKLFLKKSIDAAKKDKKKCKKLFNKKKL